MTRLIIFITFISISTFSFSQKKNNEFKKEADSIIRAEFPRARTFNIEYENAFARDFDSKLFDENFQTGTIENQKRINFSANIPFYKYKKWTFTASANYAYHQFDFKNIENVSTTAAFNQNETADFHQISGAISTTLFSSLFKKPLIYNASLIIDGNEKGLERIKGLIGASIILKRTANTTITTGLIVFVDPTAQIPFFPTFSYNHKFKNSDWEFDFILPQRILFRKPIATKGRLSVGAEFGGNGFYVNVDAPNFPSVFEYSQLELKSGLTYEHKITDNVIATFKGGLVNYISNRLTEKGEPNKDYIYENDQDMTGYFNVGISFNPFSKK
ncbi:hypothetical protein LPB136_00715 [Tenacibaculum todarodis]|uniref:Uncharacterized protein n=2 Tax=Tenacibaculum todarodis TaxID=1850252 RepID=A0A1L3JMK0_9FLAO|nr:hypothetical protein LPB136_00715 [Tenacibaculum todarodis]